MKAKAVPLILALTAAPAFAGGLPIFLGHHDPEYRGRVSRWPQVVRAREIERMCPAQQFAIYERDKMMLDATSPSLYRPPHFAPVAPTAPPPPVEPAPAPPPPTTPTGPDASRAPAQR